MIPPWRVCCLKMPAPSPDLGGREVDRRFEKNLLFLNVCGGDAVERVHHLDAVASLEFRLNTPTQILKLSS